MWSRIRWLLPVLAVLGMFLAFGEFPWPRPGVLPRRGQQEEPQPSAPSTRPTMPSGASARP